MNLDRPLAVIDVEATGLDPDADRIVELAIVRVTPKDLFQPERREMWTSCFNPERPIPPEVSAIHHITDADVVSAPRFVALAPTILPMLSGCDLAGFSLWRLDLAMLWAEFHRAGIEWDLSGARIIDVQAIFARKEERTLPAAVKFYLGREHIDAHHADGDAVATLAVLEAQCARYPDVGAMSLPALHTYSQYDQPRLDLAGKLARDKDGDACYNFGQRTKGIKVRDDLGFADWILARDFPAQTKQVLRTILRELEEEAPGDYDERDPWLDMPPEEE